MSTEPQSTICTEDDLVNFRNLAEIPAEITVNSAGNVRPEMCTEGFAVIYEYPFKIGFHWPFSPLAKEFMCEFDLSPGQLMPQFWRVFLVIERLTSQWDSPMNVKDLLTAYKVTKDQYWRYSLFSRHKGDNTLVLHTGVNDRGWKKRYVFVRLATLDSDSSWIREGWNMTDIDFEKVEPDGESEAKVKKFLEFSVKERSYAWLQLEDDDAVFLGDRIRVGREEAKKSDEGEEESERAKGDDLEVEIVGESQVQATSSVVKKVTQVEMARKARVDEEKDTPTVRSRIPKRKEVPTAGSGLLKRTKVSVSREPSLKTGSPSRVALSRKAKATVAPGVRSGDTAQPATVSPAILPDPLTAGGGKGMQKGPVGETTINFTLPSDFLDDNVLDETKLFPHLEKYLLPSFRERFDGFSFEKKEFHAAGLLFLALQTTLALKADAANVEVQKASVSADETRALAKERAALEHEETVSKHLDQVQDELHALIHTKDEMDQQLKESLTLMHDQREELDGMQISLSATKKKVEGIKVRVTNLKRELEEVKLGNELFFSYARLTARAAIMRRHLLGKEPLSSASQELEAFLKGVGTERDLDLDDEKNVEVVPDEDLQVETQGKDAANDPSFV